jgi:hypothetical protein
MTLMQFLVIMFGPVIVLAILAGYILLTNRKSGNGSAA